MMQAVVSDTNLVLVLLSLASVISSGSSFSLTRSIYDAEQNIAEDASLDSQESPLDAPETSQQKPRNPQPFRDRYVKINSSPSQHVSVTAGGRLELECSVSGSPPPQIYWVRGENPERQVDKLEHKSVVNVSYTAISTEQSKLVIDCVTPQDQGLIHCVGLSGDNMVISQPTVLHVQGRNVSSSSSSRVECQEEASSPPVITRHRSYYFSKIGTTVELPCEAIGNPRPHIEWLTPLDKPLSDPRFTVQPDGNLIISNIDWLDMGVYKCIAKSSAGHDTAGNFVYPTKPSNQSDQEANAL